MLPVYQTWQARFEWLLRLIWWRNETYFRSQTPEYRPGEGFVPVRFSDSDIEQMAGEMEAAKRGT